MLLRNEFLEFLALLEGITTGVNHDSYAFIVINHIGVFLKRIECEGF
jgi:hypothetical protein